MQAVHEECEVELKAYSYARESFALCREVSTVAEKIKGMINNKWGICEEDQIEFDEIMTIKFPGICRFGGGAGWHGDC